MKKINGNDKINYVSIQNYGKFCERITVENPNKQISNVIPSFQTQDLCSRPNPRSKQDSTMTSSTKEKCNGSNISEDMNFFAIPPHDPEGVLLDLSDLPLLCSSQMGEEIVFGSADHALYSISITLSKSTLNSKTNSSCSDRLVCDKDASPLIIAMYSKSAGHTDWVTAVCHLTDGRVLSGGMDNRMCLWKKDRKSCEFLQGHDSSISKAISIHPCNMAITAGYDKKCSVWKFKVDSIETLRDNVIKRCNVRQSSNSKSVSIPSRPIDYLLGHSHPVLACEILSSNLSIAINSTFDMNSAVSEISVVSYDRIGEIKVWDLNTCQSVATYTPLSNRSTVTAIHTSANIYSIHPSTLSLQFNISNESSSNASSNNIFYTGSSDGCVRVWDVRQGFRPALTIPVHTTKSAGTPASAEPKPQITKQPKIVSAPYAVSTAAKTFNTFTVVKPSSTSRASIPHHTEICLQQPSPHSKYASRSIHVSSSPSTPSILTEAGQTFYSNGISSTDSSGQTYKRSLKPSRLVAKSASQTIVSAVIDVSSEPVTRKIDPPASADFSDNVVADIVNDINSLNCNSCEPNHNIAKSISSRFAKNSGSVNNLRGPISNTTRGSEIGRIVPNPTVTASSRVSYPVTSLACYQSQFNSSSNSFDRHGCILLSGGADGKLALLDIRKFQTQVGTDSPRAYEGCIVSEYCGHSGGVYAVHAITDRSRGAGVGKIVFTADGGGNVHCLQLGVKSRTADVSSPGFSDSSDRSLNLNCGNLEISCRYGLGACSNGAVRMFHSYENLKTNERFLVCGGDDGKAIVYRY